MSQDRGRKQLRCRPQIKESSSPSASFSSSSSSSSSSWCDVDSVASQESCLHVCAYPRATSTRCRFTRLAMYLCCPISASSSNPHRSKKAPAGLCQQQQQQQQQQQFPAYEAVVLLLAFLCLSIGASYTNTSRLSLTLTSPLIAASSAIDRGISQTSSPSSPLSGQGSPAIANSPCSSLGRATSSKTAGGSVEDELIPPLLHQVSIAVTKQQHRRRSNPRATCRHRSCGRCQSWDFPPFSRHTDSTRALPSALPTAARRLLPPNDDNAWKPGRTSGVEQKLPASPRVGG